MLSAKRQPSRTSVFFAPLASIGYLIVRPRLLLLAAAPVLINFLVFAILVFLSYEFIAGPVTRSIEIESQTLDAILSWLSGVLLMLFLIVVSGLVSFILIIPISAPFNDLISERIEKEQLASAPELLAPEQSILTGIKHAILDSLRRLTVEIPILLALFALGFIPIIGPPLVLLLGIINNAFFFSLDAYSYSLDRRTMTFRQKWQWLGAHQRIRIPLGLGIALMLIIPCSIAIVPVLGAVAATRLYCETVLAEKAISRQNVSCG